MYKVTNTHVENFAQAYRYLGVPRWWFEQIGYWGQLGANAPSEKSPSPVRHYSFPTENSLEAYRAKYPRGYNASVPYYGMSLVVLECIINSSVLMLLMYVYIGSTLGASATEGDYFTGSSSVLPSVGTLLSVMLGMCVGSVVTAMYFQSQKRYAGYSPLQ